MRSVLIERLELQRRDGALQIIALLGMPSFSERVGMVSDTQ